MQLLTQYYLVISGSFFLSPDVTQLRPPWILAVPTDDYFDSAPKTGNITTCARHLSVLSCVIVASQWKHLNYIMYGCVYVRDTINVYMRTQ